MEFYYDFDYNYKILYDLLLEENAKAPLLSQRYNDVEKYLSNWQNVWSNNGIVLEINQALRLAQITVNQNKKVSSSNTWTAIANNFPAEYLPPLNLRQLAYSTDTFVEINLGKSNLQCISPSTGTKRLRTVFTYRYRGLDAPEPIDPDPDDPEEDENNS